MGDISKTLNLMFNPLASVLGTANRPDWAPSLSIDKGKDAALWNAALAGITYGGLGYGLTKLMNKRNLDKWRKKRTAIIQNKLNAIMPEASPNIDTNDLLSEEAARRKGVDESLEKVAIDPEALKKVAGLADYFLWAPLPVLTAIGGYLTTQGLVDKNDVEERVADLNKINAEKRNKLAQLHGKILEMKYGNMLNKTTPDTIQKEAEDKPTVPDYVPQGGAGAWIVGDDTHRSMLGTYTAGSAAAIGIMSLLAALASYKYTKARDKDTATYKALQDLSARNLTNIPEDVGVDVAATNDAKKRALLAKEQAKIKALGEPSTPVANTAQTLFA